MKIFVMHESISTQNYLLPIPGSHDAASHDTAAEEQLKELYNCSFLVDDPSPTQLEGVCNKHKN